MGCIPWDTTKFAASVVVAGPGFRVELADDGSTEMLDLGAPEVDDLLAGLLLISSLGWSCTWPGVWVGSSWTSGVTSSPDIILGDRSRMPSCSLVMERVTGFCTGQGRRSIATVCHKLKRIPLLTPMWRFSAPLVPRQECQHGPQKMRLIILESTGWHTDGGHNRWGRADRGPRGHLTQAPWWKGKVKSNPGSPAWHSNSWKRGSPNSSRNKVNASH